MSFLFPPEDTEVICNSKDDMSENEKIIDFMIQYSARLRDVEIATGFTFNFLTEPLQNLHFKLKLAEKDEFWNQNEILSSGSTLLFSSVLLLLLII